MVSNNDWHHRGIAHGVVDRVDDDRGDEVMDEAELEDIPCPRCVLGELGRVENRPFLHCSICGYYQKMEDDEYD